MPTTRIKISCTGLSPREAKSGQPFLEADLASRPQIQNPLTTYLKDSETLLVIIEATGEKPTALANAALELISESIITNFPHSSGELHFQIEETTPIP
jgi:hypothetical protein